MLKEYSLRRWPMASLIENGVVTSPENHTKELGRLVLRKKTYPVNGTIVTCIAEKAAKDLLKRLIVIFQIVSSNRPLTGIQQLIKIVTLFLIYQQNRSSELHEVGYVSEKSKSVIFLTTNAYNRIH